MTLQEFFQYYPKIAVAFSGGTDSAYLLYMAKQYAKETMGIYVSTALQPAFEKEDAIRFCKTYDIPLKMISCDIFQNDVVVQNPADRCYHCKTALFSQILKTAGEEGFSCLADGTNASDDAADRPGMRALKELKVLSPLRICGITKSALRADSEKLGLFTAGKPAYACLATRIPTGTPLTAARLAQVETAENALFQMGFTDFRVRCLRDAAKLQIPEDQFPMAVEKRTELVALLEPLFGNVYLDLKAR